MRRAFLAVVVCLAPVMAQAIDPSELLADPVLEARAREITRELRCVVCQSESIDASNADIARDLRMLVRERISAGDTNEQALGFIVDRYGEYVLLRPPFSAANAPLWLAGPMFLIFGAALSAAFVRRRAREVRRPRQDLSPEEQARIDALLKE